jgi:hypothetical protein
MNKGIADQFIRNIASDENNGKDARVIIVRSNRNMKRFITDALGEVEHLVALVKEGLLRWSAIGDRANQLAELADSYEQHNISIAARDIGNLARELGDGPNHDDELRKVFGDFVTYLSTMLLRVYIEGNDVKCIWELASVEVLLTQARRRARHAERQREASARWMN